MSALTLFEKIWKEHSVMEKPGQPALLYIDLHLIHEVTSPQAFEAMRNAGRKVRATGRTFGTLDHNVPTVGRDLPIEDADSSIQVEMMKKNSPPLLEGVPIGLMRLFMEREIADYLGIPDRPIEQHLARIVVEFAKFVDRDLEAFHWQAMIFRHHILSIIEGMIEMEAGDQREFFRLPTHLHQKWRGANPKSEEGLWGHLADWITSRV